MFNSVLIDLFIIKRPFVIIVLFIPKGKVRFVDAMFTMGCFYNKMEILLLKKKE